jgi:hypothetical protein
VVPQPGRRRHAEYYLRGDQLVEEHTHE